MSKPITWAVAVVLAIVVGFGLYWFAPWRLATSTTVSEPVPLVAPSPSETPGDQRVALLAEGNFVSHEHKTTGKAEIVQLYSNGHTQLVLVGLDTSDGPDLKVWLTEQHVTAKNKNAYDDGKWVELGPLKGNKGNQVYDIPRGTDLTALYSVTIWCKRFSVSFGAAELKQVPRN